MAKARAVTVTKVKKKAWHTILAPKEQNNALIGETYVTAPEVAIGRTIHANLKTVTDNLRDQNAYLTFKVTQIAGKNLNTEVTGYYLTPASIKKTTRRNTSRVDDSFVVETKDGKKVRIKPVAITLHKTVHSVKTAMRKKMRNTIANEIAGMEFNTLIQSLINRRFQNGLKKKISKVYPVRGLQIKDLSYAKKAKNLVKGKEEVEDKKPAEPKKAKVKKEKKSLSEEMVEDLKENTPQVKVEDSKVEKKVEVIAEKKEEPAKVEAKDSENFGEE